MNRTSIEWTHRPETGGAAGGFTWNPIRARTPRGNIGTVNDVKVGTFCTRISPGCTNCYASTINKRFGNGLEYTVPNLEKVEFFISEKILEEPLRRKKPATIFVGDMFDLFHEAIPTEFIAEVLRVAVKTPRHTFQFLTKRADRMLTLVRGAQQHWRQRFPEHMWFGVSVESQKYADERIPLLLQTPAAVRFLSVEPMLEAVKLTELYGGMVDWVICGGESGPGARPFNLAWAESLQAQCKTAGVAFFMKQCGSYPGRWGEGALCDLGPIRMRDRKGGDPSEWPEALRVREFPAERLVTA
jgi:protein gp37